MKAIKITESFSKKLPAEILNKIAPLLVRSMEIDDADKCTLQVYDWANEALHLLAGVNFSDDFYSHFAVVHPFDSSVCGRAIGIGSPVIVSDVRKDVVFAPHLQLAKAEGFRAVKAFPVFKKKQRVGVISTHFKEVKWNWNLNTFDPLADDLAEMLEEVCMLLNFQPAVATQPTGAVQNK